MSDRPVNVALAKLVGALKSDIVSVGVTDIPDCDWLDTGIPELNEAISDNKKKGIPLGITVEISGDSQTGKTYLMAHLMGQCQKAGGIVFHADAESAFNPGYAKKTHGVIPEDIVKVETNVMEDIITTIKQLVTVRMDQVKKEKITPQDLPPILFFIDSFKMCVSRREDESDKMTAGFNVQKTLAFSVHYPEVHFKLGYARITVVWINQVRQTIGTFVSTKESTGGDGIKFYPHIRLRLKNLGKVEKQENNVKRTTGRKIEMKAIKTRWTYPDRKVTIILDHTAGWSITDNEEPSPRDAVDE